MNQKGLTPPIVLFVVAIGLIAFFVIASVTPFKDTLFSTLFPKPASHASGVTYYVSDTGNDDRDGRSEATAWKTITKANKVVRAGETVYLKGIFKDQVIYPDYNGEGEEARIIYKSSPRGSATVDLGGVVEPLKYLAYFINKSYITLDGIKFTNSEADPTPTSNGFSKNMLHHGIRILDSHHITVKYSSFENANITIEGDGSDNNIIDHNSFKYYYYAYSTAPATAGRPLNSGDTISIERGADNNTISSNNIQYGGHTLISITGYGSQDNPNGGNASERNKIENNILINNDSSAIIIGANTPGTVVQNNKISTPLSPDPKAELISQGPNDIGGEITTTLGIELIGQGNFIRNNVIKNIHGWGIGLSSHWYCGAPYEAKCLVTNASNNKIYNNIFDGIQGSAISLSHSVGAGARDKYPCPEDNKKSSLDGCAEIAGTAENKIVLTNNLFANNIIYNSRGTAVGVNNPDIYYKADFLRPFGNDFGGNKILNNIIYNNTPANRVLAVKMVKERFFDTAIDNITRQPRNRWRTRDIAPTFFSLDQLQSTYTPNIKANLIVNPDFIDPAAGNYRLKSGSKIRGKGYAIADEASPQGNPDVGLYNFTLGPLPAEPEVAPPATPGASASPVPSASPSSSFPPASSFGPNCTPCNSDINKDGQVNDIDYNLSVDCRDRAVVGRIRPADCSRTDVDDNGTVNSVDGRCIQANYTETCSANVK